MATAQVDQTQTVTTPDDATATAAADRAPETLDLPQAPARTLPPEASVRHASDGLGAIEIGEDDDSTAPADNTQVAGQRRVEAEGQVGEADSAAPDGRRSDANDGDAQAAHTRPNAGPQGHAARSADGQHAAVEGVGSEVSPQAEVDTESETATTESAPRTTHRAYETPAADLARRTPARVTEPLPETDNSQTQAQTEAASEDDTVYDGGTLPEVVVRPVYASQEKLRVFLTALRQHHEAYQSVVRMTAPFKAIEVGESPLPYHMLGSPGIEVRYEITDQQLNTYAANLVTHSGMASTYLQQVSAVLTDVYMENEKNNADRHAQAEDHESQRAAVKAADLNKFFSEKDLEKRV